MPDQEELLFQRLDSAVLKHGAQTKRLKRLTYGFLILTLLFAAASTVLLGLNFEGHPGYLVWSRNLALVFGAISTFVVSLGAFWNLEAYWLKHKVLFARLRALREGCEFLRAKTGTLSSDQVANAFSEYHALMDGQIEYWEKAAEQALSQPQHPALEPSRSAT